MSASMSGKLAVDGVEEVGAQRGVAADRHVAGERGGADPVERRPAGRGVAVRGRDDGDERRPVAAPVGGCRRALDAVDPGERLRDRAGVAGAHEHVEGRERARADARVLQLLEAGARGPAVRERVGARVAELDRGGGDDERGQHGGGSDGRGPAVAHDEARPGRPAAARAGLAPVARPVELRPDRRQQDRQERDGHGDADERDQQARDADAAQERHRQDDEREQRDRDGRAAEDDGGAGVLHRVAHRRVVRRRPAAGAPRASGPRRAARSRSRCRARSARRGTGRSATRR